MTLAMMMMMVMLLKYCSHQLLLLKSGLELGTFIIFKSEL